MKKIGLLLLILIVLVGGLISYKVYNRYNYNGELIGIKGTSIYHRDNCQFVKKASIERLLFFKDLQDSANKVYRACKTCKPTDNSKLLEVVVNQKEEALKKQQEVDDKKIKEYQERLTQYIKDIKDGKVITHGLFDDVTIMSGGIPSGIYINKKDEPSWYKKKVPSFMDTIKY